MVNQYALAAKATVAAGQAKMAVRRETEKALSGEVSIEYTLIVGFVAIAIIGALTVLGNVLDTKLNFIADTIKNTSSVTPTV